MTDFDARKETIDAILRRFPIWKTESLNQLSRSISYIEVAGGTMAPPPR